MKNEGGEHDTTEKGLFSTLVHGYRPPPYAYPPSPYSQGGSAFYSPPQHSYAPPHGYPTSHGHGYPYAG